MATARLRVLGFGSVYNEEHRVAPVLDKCEALLDEKIVDELVIVDDGSTDGTTEMVRRHPRFTCIRHEKNKGNGASIKDGYHYAIDNGFDAIVLWAMNGKDEPMEAKQVLAPILQGRADYVQGSRFLPGGSNLRLPPHRRVSIHAFTAVFSVLAGHRFTDCTNGFRAYTTEFLKDTRNAWDQPWIGDKYELEYYVHYQAAAHFRVAEVAVSKNYPNDNQSYSKIRPSDWLRMLRPMVYLRLGLRH